MNILEILKVIIIGIVEGITEWLPISSTGHKTKCKHRIQINVYGGYTAWCYFGGCGFIF